MSNKESNGAFFCPIDNVNQFRDMSEMANYLVIGMQNMKKDIVQVLTFRNKREKDSGVKVNDHQKKNFRKQHLSI